MQTRKPHQAPAKPFANINSAASSASATTDLTVFPSPGFMRDGVQPNGLKSREIAPNALCKRGPRTKTLVCHGAGMNLQHECVVVHYMSPPSTTIFTSPYVRQVVQRHGILFIVVTSGHVIRLQSFETLE